MMLSKRWFVRIICMLGLLMIILSVFSACSSAPRLPALSSDAVVLAFGDSLTAGTGAAPEAGYPEELSRLIGRRVINAGVPGEVTAAGLQRLPELLDREKPALVVLCLGGNDFLQRLDLLQAEQNMRAMVAMIHERGIGVVLIGVPRLGLGLEVPDWYPRIAADAAIPYEGRVLQRILSDHQLKSDPIHPNAAGYRQLAEALAALLRKAGALQ